MSKVTETLERCHGCGEIKLLTEFPKNKSRRSGYGARCRVCHNDQVKARYKRNPEPYRRAVMKRTFGISLEEYDVLHDKQNGVCAICGECETTPYRDGVRRLAVDHDHVTGRIRGLLCVNCNNGLGRFKDSQILLAAAMAYLD